MSADILLYLGAGQLSLAVAMFMAGYAVNRWGVESDR